LSHEARQGMSGLANQDYSNVNSEVLEGAFHTQEDTETWSVYHMDCLQMFPSPELGLLEKEQRCSNKDKGLSSEGHWQVSDKGEDGSNAHHEYTYRVRGSDKAVPKHNRLFEPTDVLDMCGYVKVMGDDALDAAKICKTAAKMVLLLFHHIKVHYTYTLSHTGKENDDANVEMDVEVDSDDEADDLEEGTMDKDENEPWFDLIFNF
jgi:hypothetical protein